MTADTRPKDTIRDAFEAMLWFLACLIGPLRPRKITPAEEIGALAHEVVAGTIVTPSRVVALSDVSQAWEDAAASPRLVLVP